MLVSPGTGLPVLGASGSGNSSRVRPSLSSLPLEVCVVSPFLVVIVVHFIGADRSPRSASFLTLPGRGRIPLDPRWSARPARRGPPSPSFIPGLEVVCEVVRHPPEFGLDLVVKHDPGALDVTLAIPPLAPVDLVSCLVCRPSAD